MTPLVVVLMDGFKKRIEALGTGTGSVMVKIMTPRDNDVGAIDFTNVMVCFLSTVFVRSTFCLNALNIGILRKRSDGGYLIPIAIACFDAIIQERF